MFATGHVEVVELKGVTVCLRAIGRIIQVVIVRDTCIRLAIRMPIANLWPKFAKSG
jgi:hypothetical protein